MKIGDFLSSLLNMTPKELIGSVVVGLVIATGGGYFVSRFLTVEALAAENQQSTVKNVRSIEEITAAIDKLVKAKEIEQATEEQRRRIRECLREHSNDPERCTE